MRLARLAALGLALGVIAGFAIALLRPRPQARPGNLPPPFGRDGVQTEAQDVRDSALWEQFQQADQAELPQASEGSTGSPQAGSPVLDIRTRRRVTG